MISVEPLHSEHLHSTHFEGWFTVFSNDLSRYMDLYPVVWWIFSYFCSGIAVAFLVDDRNSSLSSHTNRVQNGAVVWTSFRKTETKIGLRVKVSKSFLILFVGFLWCLYTCYISVLLIFVQRTSTIFAFSQFYFVTQTLWYSLLYGLVQSQAMSSKKAILQTIKVRINLRLKTNMLPPFSFLKLNTILEM